MAVIANIEKHGNNYTYDLVQEESGHVIPVVYKTKRELSDEENQNEKQ